MKRILYVVFFLLWSPLFASVEIRISDPNTLKELNLTEVMVGTQLSLVIHSDANDFWSGGFFIEGQDRAIGQLQARDKDPNSRDWTGSHLENAGEGASVLQWKDSNIWGFDMYADDFEREPNDWFVVDYNAISEGQCDIIFYNHDYSWTIADPNVSISFLNTPTRDLYADGFVNYVDFAVFSSYWLDSNCSDPNANCYKADFSRNGSVGLEDVIMFADFWLWGNLGWQPAEEPNTTEPNIVYDVTYAIVDTNSLAEITLEVGDSITLYVTKSSTDEDVYIFDMDVIVSDPNLGWINNTADDPNTTPVEGTAEILASPRISGFDYYGPANEPNSIQFFAANIGASMQDGDMASFVYTATEPNDVTLNLVNYGNGANLEPIIIHQVEPIVEMLQQIYTTSPQLQEKIPEPEWNEFIESVEESVN